MSRAERVTELYKWIEEHGCEYPETQLLAKFSIEKGISLNTVKEYIRELGGAKLIFRYPSKSRHYLSTIKDTEKFEKEMTKKGAIMTSSHPIKIGGIRYV